MPTPTPPEAKPPKQPMTLRDSAVALARLKEQMHVLNAKLEYLRLLLKLGVR